MLDLWIIDKLKEKDQEEEFIQLPLQAPEIYHEEVKIQKDEDEERGVMIIEL